MKKIIVCVLLTMMLLSSCSFASSTTVNGKTVSDLPYRFYVVLNEQYYAFLKNTMTEAEFKKKIHEISVRNFLTHYLVLEEADKRGVVLSEKDKRNVEDECQDFRKKHPLFSCSDEELKGLFSVYYLQEALRQAFPVTEADTKQTFHENYAAVTYCVFFKYTENGTLFDEIQLDNFKQTSYNIRDSIFSSETTIQQAIRTYSHDFARDLSSLTPEQATAALLRNEILLGDGLLINTEGEHDHLGLTFPLTEEGVTLVFRMRTGDTLVLEDNVGYWVIQRLPADAFYSEKADALLPLARSENFEKWLNTQIENATYSLPYVS